MVAENTFKTSKVLVSKIRSEMVTPSEQAKMNEPKSLMEVEKVANEGIYIGNELDSVIINEKDYEKIRKVGRELGWEDSW